jgi:hypothetical protein
LQPALVGELAHVERIVQGFVIVAVTRDARDDVGLLDAVVEALGSRRPARCCR